MSFEDRLNRGSIRALGEKTGKSLANRFGEEIRRELGPDWAGESAPVRTAIGRVLSLMGPSVTVEVMAWLGYDYDPASDGGFVGVAVDNDEPA